MELREYQQTFTDNLSRALATHRKVCAQLATGGGKTVVFSAISSRYTSKQPKSLIILVHRKELLLQTRKTLYNAFGIDAFLITAGVKYIPPARVYLGMVESVNRRLNKLQNIGMVIIDEAHIATFNKLHKVFETQLIIGFTATPLSSSKKEPMNKYYETLICGIDIPDLIKQGHLCQNITWAPKDIVDRNTLAVERGEFSESDMAIKFSKPKYIHNTVEAYEKWSKGKKAIIFNVNIQHSKAVNQAFEEAGYKTRHLDSTMDDSTRTGILKWFAETPDAVLNNVSIATTGFDEPTIDTVIVNKAVMSMPLWLQMCGRGARVTPTKSAFTIVDMGGNAISHGDWSQSRDWQRIFENPAKPSDGEGIAPVKSCPQCEAIIAASAKTCSYCGYVYPAAAEPIEEKLSEFVVVTKGIDVDLIMKQNEHKREYYTFFKIGMDLAKKAKQTIATLNEETVNFILLKYYELAKEWTKKQRDKNKDDPAKNTIRFNEWHRAKAKEHLYNELKKQFPEWEVPKEELNYFQKIGLSNAEHQYIQ